MSDDSLAVLDPPWVEISYRRWGRRRVLRMRPVRLGELARFLAAMGPVIAALNMKEINLDAYDGSVQEAIALCAGTDVSSVARLPHNVQAAASAALVTLNPEIFSEPAATRQTARRTDWADIVADLLAAGHRLEDVARYTLAQASAHLTAAGRIVNRIQADRIVAARLAWADGRTVERILRQLTRTGD